MFNRLTQYITRTVDNATSAVRRAVTGAPRDPQRNASKNTGRTNNAQQPATNAAAAALNNKRAAGNTYTSQQNTVDRSAQVTTTLTPGHMMPQPTPGVDVRVPTYDTTGNVSTAADIVMASRSTGGSRHGAAQEDTARRNVTRTLQNMDSKGARVETAPDSGKFVTVSKAIADGILTPQDAWDKYGDPDVNSGQFAYRGVVG